MTQNKIVRIALLLLAIFVVSLVFTMIDSGWSFSSAFDAGVAVGQTMKHFLKIIGILALIVMMFRLFKDSFDRMQ